MILCINRVWKLLYRLVVLLSLIISSHFEAKSVYTSRVTVRCLKYALMCTCFAHARSVIYRFVTQPWGGLAGRDLFSLRFAWISCWVSYVRE